jgi:hypothetical protein
MAHDIAPFSRNIVNREISQKIPSPHYILKQPLLPVNSSTDKLRKHTKASDEERKRDCRKKLTITTVV